MANCSKGLIRTHLNNRLRKGKENKHRLQERFGIPTATRPINKDNNECFVHVHAASIGEMRVAMALMNALLDRHPHVYFILTTMTISSAVLFEYAPTKRTIHQLTPMDVPDWINTFLDYWNPCLSIRVESEVWPNYIMACQKRSIPQLMLNARLSTHSCKRWLRFGKTIRYLLGAFDLCLARSEEDAEKLSALAQKPIAVSGDLKRAMPPAPVNPNALKDLQQAISNRPCWLFLSTHVNDDAIALEMHQFLKPHFPNVISIVLPRHPDHATNIHHQCTKQGLQARLRSSTLLPDAHTDIYIADTLGEVGLFCTSAPVTLMGKSFVKQGGGQNPLEPLQYGSTLIMGPLMENFTDLTRDILAADAAVHAENIEAAKAIALQLLRDDHTRRRYENNARVFCAGLETHIMRYYVDTISPYISKIITNGTDTGTDTGINTGVDERP